MDPRAPVFVPRLPPGLTQVVLEDGASCWVGDNILWMPTDIPAQPSSVSYTYPQEVLCQPNPGVQLTAPFHTTSPQPRGYGYQKQQMIFTGPPPVMFAPVTTNSADPIQTTLDLQMLKPEAFSCGLPTLDLPTPILHSMRLMPVVNTPASAVKAVVQTKPKLSRPQPKPKAQKPQVAKKAEPERKPLFEPVPLGAKHAKKKIKFFGNRIAVSKRPGIYETLSKTGNQVSGKSGKPSAKSVTSRKGCKALVSELPLFSEKDSHRSLSKTLPVEVIDRGKAVNKKSVSESNLSVRSDCIKEEGASDGKVSDSTEFKCSGKDTPATVCAVDTTEEYDIEYLYLTKFILRKKIRPTPLGQKRKCPDEEQSLSSPKKLKEESRNTMDIPEVLHFDTTESLLSSDILDLF